MSTTTKAIAALEYIGKVLTMHTSISTRRPTADEYEYALKDCDEALSALKAQPVDAGKEAEGGPYTTMLATDFHKEAGFFGVYIIRDGRRIAERLGQFTLVEGDKIRDELNAAYRAGQASQSAGVLITDAERKEMTEFWKSAWEEDATREMIINELHDYTVFMENTVKVYDHLTRGNISKINTIPQAVIHEVERIHQQEIDEAVAEANEEHDGAGVTVDQIMEVVDDWLNAMFPDSKHMRHPLGSPYRTDQAAQDALRDRLTALTKVSKEG